LQLKSKAYCRASNFRSLIFLHSLNFWKRGEMMVATAGVDAASFLPRSCYLMVSISKAFSV
jgi:hypothetical protein